MYGWPYKTKLALGQTKGNLEMSRFWFGPCGITPDFDSDEFWMSEAYCEVLLRRYRQRQRYRRLGRETTIVRSLQSRSRSDCCNFAKISAESAEFTSLSSIRRIRPMLFFKVARYNDFIGLTPLLVSCPSIHHLFDYRFRNWSSNNNHRDDIPGHYRRSQLDSKIYEKTSLPDKYFGGLFWRYFLVLWTASKNFGVWAEIGKRRSPGSRIGRR